MRAASTAAVTTADVRVIRLIGRKAHRGHAWQNRELRDVAVNK
jgi:hypothetical protein